MKVGDVIPVNIPDAIIATVDGVPLLECKFGQQQGQYAIQIERFIASEKQDSMQGENHG
jgi:flagellar motor switch protein FliM